MLLRKLGFLKRTLSDGATGVGAATMESMVDDVGSLCLVKECRELEERFGTHFTGLGRAAHQTAAIGFKTVK